MRTSHPGSLIVMLCAVAWCNRAAAADDQAALRCTAIADDAARLACYDSIFRTPGGTTPVGAATAAAPTGAGAPPASAAATAAAAAGATPPATPTQDFGLTPARKQSLEAAEAKATGAPKPPEEPAVPDSLTARVATAAHRVTGELVVILDNGQVWVQIDTETKGRVREGDEVTIRKGTLGSFLLVTPNHILVRVRRVK